MRYLNNHIAIFIRVVIVLVQLLFFSKADATTYYSRSSGANWNATNSWSTVTYGGAAAGSYPVGGDTVNIDNGITVFVNANSGCSVLNIGQGTSGVIQFASTGSYTLTVSNKITINNGGRLWYNSNNTRAHTLSLAGDLVNNGIVDFIYDGNDVVNLTFSGANNSVISGTGTWTLNNVTMLKSSASYYVEIQPTTFESAIATLTTTSGTYIHNNSSSYSINSAGSSDFTITSNTAFKIPQGTVAFAPTSNNLYLQGSLYVNGGTVYVGTTSGSGGIQYDASNGPTPYLEISSGSLDVYCAIVNKTITDAFNFNMSGGTLLLNNGSSNVSNVFIVNDVINSIFTMSGGTLIIQNHNNGGGSNGVDFSCGGAIAAVTSTGGTIQFGNNSTATGTKFVFEPFSNVVQPHFKITGSQAAVITLCPSKNAPDDIKILSLYIDTNKVYDNRNIQGTNDDSKTMTITSTMDGTHALYNRGTFTARTGTVTLTGVYEQSIGGTSPMTFYNLTINSSADARLAAAESVSNQLTMISGRLTTTATNILTCTSTASANIGNASSYVDGPMIHTVATTSSSIKTYPIGKGSSYRPAVMTVTHSDVTSVTYKAEVINSSAMALGYALPASLAKVSYTRYWNFTRESVSNFSTATMQLYYDTDDSVTTASNVRVAHDDGSANWVNYGGTGTANVTGSITSSAINSFKTKFALGFPPATLPVELVTFNATRDNHAVRCEWTTASETNNNYFVVERSADGMHYDSLLSVHGEGNSSKMNHYAAVDKKPLQGSSYYRLRQVDFDGTAHLSKAVHVSVLEEDEHIYTVYPNPANSNTLYINKDGEDMANVKVMVQDMTGREVTSKAQLSLNNKVISLTVDPKASGENQMLMVSVLYGNKMQREKVLMEK